MTECTIVIEDAGNNDFAHVPDLPGCVSTGATLEEVTEHIREAIVVQIAFLRESAPKWGR
jgi:predicted RNase H-like HicB family nuclease